MAKEHKPDSEDTQDTDLLGLILDKLEELCTQQRKQGEDLCKQSQKIKEIAEKLVELEANVSLIRQAQVEQGKAIANMRQICDERSTYYQMPRGVDVGHS